ncbi:dTDP-glucose 4,6-dehydratase, partial [Elusimicrobiota bacterium]
AAESHVDRSIYGPKEFIYTNIVGTFNLLEAARLYWQDAKDILFHHVSTDEVYGSVKEGYFYEDTRYSPNSPYAASKAASDHLVRAYFKTYGMPVIISNCSNNYGPYQFPEKMIPLMIVNALEGKELPVYGKGLNVRDWLYVDDHCSGIWTIINKGKSGEVYNIGTDNQWKNIDMVHFICDKIASITGESPEKYKSLIKFVTDRPGHDLRYAINADKLKGQLNWSPAHSFEEKIEKTIRWYMENKTWIANIKSGDYKKWIDKHYGEN